MQIALFGLTQHTYYLWGVEYISCDASKLFITVILPMRVFGVTSHLLFWTFFPNAPYNLVAGIFPHLT